MALLDLMDAARRVSVPIVVIRTADQAMTIAETAKRMVGPLAGPLIMWDAAVGMRPVDGNKLAQKALADAKILNTRRRFASLSPTYLLSVATRSKATVGTPASLPSALAISDFPPPGTPWPAVRLEAPTRRFGASVAGLGARSPECANRAFQKTAARRA